MPRNSEAQPQKQGKLDGKAQPFRTSSGTAAKDYDIKHFTHITPSSLMFKLLNSLRKIMIVYKYLHPDRIDVLKNSKIRFTQPDALNDPFESFPSFQKYKAIKEEEVKSEYKRASNEEIDSERLTRILTPFKAELENIRNTFGDSLAILSLTKKNNNGLMWSHYGDSYKGFVIGFDSDCDFFKPGKGKSRHGIREVKYSAKREDAFVNDITHEIEKELDLFFYTKSVDWKYEEELRIYAHPKAADEVPATIDGFDLCLFNFPKECVKEVIIGFRMKTDKRDEIIKIIDNEYPDAKLFLAALSETDFDLDILPL